mmetsp:Transcript_37893/g.93990  ORF Transcript_37893/g.93990 Transcript_37893/m.93990 type:complete len:214 (-) Transcript_37893:197-838(-)
MKATRPTHTPVSPPPALLAPTVKMTGARSRSRPGTAPATIASAAPPKSREPNNKPSTTKAATVAGCENTTNGHTLAAAARNASSGASERSIKSRPRERREQSNTQRASERRAVRTTTSRGDGPAGTCASAPSPCPLPAYSSRCARLAFGRLPPSPAGGRAGGAAVDSADARRAWQAIARASASSDALIQIWNVIACAAPARGEEAAAEAEARA